MLNTFTKKKKKYVHVLLTDLRRVTQHKSEILGPHMNHNNKKISYTLMLYFKFQVFFIVTAQILPVTGGSFIL